MESLKIKTHTDLTGKMTIEIPTEMKDSDIEAIKKPSHKISPKLTKLSQTSIINHA